MAALAALMLFGAVLVPATASAQSPSDENSFVNLINQVRADNGLNPLTVNNELITLSRGWAGEQRDGVCGLDEDGDRKHICHANPISEGVTQDWAKLGENVGTGPAIDPVMDAFIASPSHYRNIIDPEFTHIGVGVVWEGGRLYTTHRFMTLKTPAPAPTTTTPPTTTAAPTTTTAPTTTAPAPAPTTAAPTTSTEPAPTTTEPTTTAAPTTTGALATAPTPAEPETNSGEADRPASPLAEVPRALPFTADEDVNGAEDAVDEAASAAPEGPFPSDPESTETVDQRVAVLLNSLNALETAR